MSIKGSPRVWFEAAVQRGELAAAVAEVDALRPLGLGYALGLTVLLAEARDPRADRAIARWLARLTLERPGVATADVRAGTARLRSLGR